MRNPIRILPDTVRPPLRVADLENEWKNPEKAKKDVKNYIKDEVLTLNFYRVHMLYFIIVIAITSVIVYGEGLANGPELVGGSHVTYIDALFLCTSAMTTTGLTTVNIGWMSAFQQSVLVVLMILGNVTFVSTFTVLIRRHFFRRRLADVIQHSDAARRRVDDIEQSQYVKRTGAEPEMGNNPSGSLRKRQTSPKQGLRKAYSQIGYGTWPAPWEWAGIRRIFSRPFRRLKVDWEMREQSYITFKPRFDEKGRFKELTEDERREVGGVEYRALGVLLVFLTVYQIAWLTIGTLFLVPYSYRSSVETVLKTSQSGPLNPGCAPGGLNLLNANFIPLRGFYYILTVEILLTVAGNTQFPIFLRLMIWSLSKAVPQKSRLKQTLQFLLDHPRRCFLYLFPSKETWYLVAIQLSIDITAAILFNILNIGMPAVEELPTGVRIFDGLFQATGLRTSGSYIIALSSLAPALLITYLSIMYVSSYPVVMALRQTNTYEERSIGIDKGESGGGLSQHLRRQLVYDLWFLNLAWVLICIVERGKLTDDQDGFAMFEILFETVSAYGTVGLSTGVSYDTISLAGAFQTLSKVILLFVMLRGRHRGLPLAIDRSILLPGEDLMHEMDKHYYGRSKDELKELERAEESSILPSPDLAASSGSNETNKDR